MKRLIFLLPCFLALSACDDEGDGNANDSCSEAGTRKCENNAVLECQEDGGWTVFRSCDEDDLVCEANEFAVTCKTRSCAENATRCSEDTIEICVDNVWRLETDCTATSQFCSDRGTLPACVDSRCDIEEFTPTSVWAMADANLTTAQAGYLWEAGTAVTRSVWFYNFPSPSGMPVGQTGMRELTGDELDPSKCGVCIDANDGTIRLLPQSGFVEFKEVGGDLGERLHVIITDLVLVEVNTQDGEPVQGGAIWCIPSLTIDETFGPFPCAFFAQLAPAIGGAACLGDGGSGIKTAVTCEASTVWTDGDLVTTACASGQTCGVGGIYKAECTDGCTAAEQGNQRCSSADNIAVCQDEVWLTETDCQSQSCDDTTESAVCVGSCDGVGEGTTRCDSGRLEICGGGLWQLVEDCVANALACLDLPAPACADACTEDGQTRCAAGNVETCNGTAWLVSTTCEAEQACDKPAGKEPACFDACDNPEGQVRQRCKSDYSAVEECNGTSYQASTTGPAADGSCVDAGTCLESGDGTEAMCSGCNSSDCDSCGSIGDQLCLGNKILECTDTVWSDDNTLGPDGYGTCGDFRVCARKSPTEVVCRFQECTETEEFVQRCALDFIQVCRDIGGGAYRWEDDTDCDQDQSAQVCRITVADQTGCFDPCDVNGSLRCTPSENATRLEECVDGAYRLNTDCALTGQECVPDGTPACFDP